MKKLALFTIVALAAAIAVPLRATAQRRSEERATRSVQGTVTDGGDNAVEGAIVQLRDTKSLQIRSFITKQDGGFHFHNLNPDIDYELKAQHQGVNSDSKTLSSFDTRKTATINLKVKK